MNNNLFKSISLLIITGICVSYSPASSYASESDIGTSACQFLKLGVGARACGMGEAFTAVADDWSTSYWNPAGLSLITNTSLGFMHAMWFESISYDWVSYVKPLGSGGALGASFQYFSYGAIAETDDTGLDTGSFSPTDLAVILSYARDIGSCPVGINVKYISSQIKDSGTAYAADLGILCPNGSWMFGGVVQNLGTSMKIGTGEASPLPMNIKIGCANYVKENWVFSADVSLPSDSSLYFGAGSEYVFKLKDMITMSPRAGYNTKAKDTGGLNGITIGFGFTLKSLLFDYAFVPYGDLGNTQRVSLSMKF